MDERMKEKTSVTEFEIDTNGIDYNELSLFSTPIGKTVAFEMANLLLRKKDKTSLYDSYIEQVHQSLCDVAQSFDDITLTIKLIKFAHPQIKSFKMTRVDRGEYLKYHIENYFFRLPKIKDQVLSLLNAVYRLGYTHSNSLERKVRDTAIIKEKKLYLHLDYLDDAFREIKPIRNLIAHRRDLTDSNLAMLTAYTLKKYDQKLYETILKGQISYTKVFEKNQGILKQSIIILLLMIGDDFIKISKATG